MKTTSLLHKYSNSVKIHTTNILTKTYF